MKARTIRRLRKEISKKGYYEKRWRKFAEECKRWDRFNTFECNSFFVGENKAQLNQWIYDKHAEKAMKKCDYYRRKVTGEE